MSTESDLAAQKAVLAALSRKECRHIDVLAEATGLVRRSVIRTCQGLLIAGFAERREVGCYVLTAAGAAFLKSGKRSLPKPPVPRRLRRRTIRDKVWAAIRILGKASTPEILELVGGVDGRRQVGVRGYLGMLARAGYVRELPKRAAGTALTSSGFKRWVLLRDTGPDAPVERAEAMWDRNLEIEFAMTPLARTPR